MGIVDDGPVILHESLTNNLLTYLHTWCLSSPSTLSTFKVGENLWSYPEDFVP